MFNLFIPPIFQDSETTRKARIFFSLLLSSAVIITILEILDWYISPQYYMRWLYIIFSYNIACLILLVLNKKGYTQFAAYFFIGFIFILTLRLAWFAGGMQSSAIGNFPIIVLFTGLVLGWQKGFIAAMIAILAGLGLVASEHYALLPVNTVHLNSLGLWQNSIVNIGLLALLQYVAVASLNKALDESQQELIQRKKAENDLRSSEAHFRDLWQATVEGIAIHDNAIIMEVNDAMCQMFGYQREQVIGKSLFDFTPIEIHDRIRKRLASEVKEHVEIPALRSNSDTIILEVFAKQVIFKGRPMRMVGSRDITERKRAEEELRESRERYKTLIENTPDIIARFDKDLRYLFVNSAISEASSLKPDEFIGKTMRDVGFTKEQADLRESLIRLVISSGNPVVHEFEFVGKKGRHVYEWRASPEIDSQGNVESILVINRNITERKKAEEELQQRVEELVALYELARTANASLALRETMQAALTVMLCALHADLAFLFLRDGERLILQDVLPSASRQRFGDIPEHRVGECMCGLAVQEKKPLYSRDIFNDHRCTWDECKQTAIKSFAALPLYNGQEVIGVIGLASDTERDFEMQKRFLETLTNQVSVAVVDARLYETVQQELRERKQAEKRLADSQKLLQEITDNSTSLIYALDLQGRFMLINRSLESVFGVSRDTLIGKTREAIMSSEFAATQRAGDLQVINNRLPITVEEENIEQDGTHTYLSVKFPLLDLQDNMYGVGVISTDITEQKKFQNQFLQSQKMQTIGTLAGGIAHDFNNILGIIMGYSSLIEKRVEDKKKIMESSVAITKAAERGAALVRQILTFARRTDVSFEPLSIPDFIDELISMLEQTFPKVIEICKIIEGNIPIINADLTQMHQALLNLCLNARDAMPSGGMLALHVLTVEYAIVKKHFSTASAERYVCISVSDTGNGMDRITKNRSFDPFFTTKEKGKGTGLGLSVVYGVMQTHHGFVDVESEVGKGSTFFLYFPVPLESEFDQEQVDSVSYNAPGGTETILLVEDEELLRNMFKELLESKGYHVYTAADGLEAVNVYTTHHAKIDLVLTDVGLPKMTGFEEFKKLKGANPNVKILIASGFYEPDMKTEMYKAGVKGFLNKPYKPEEALRKIRAVLDGE